MACGYQQTRQWNRVAFTASAAGLAVGVVWLVQLLAH